jgi:hypothetical protein
MKTMLRTMLALPEAAIHYSLGTLVLVTHLVVVAVQDARHDLRV